MNFANSNSNYKDPYLQERIAEKLTHLFTPVSRIDKIIYTVIKELMQTKLVPYFTDVITRHTEEEFHQKLAEGFDLVEDMRINHPHLFWAFIKVTRKFKHRLVFNDCVLLTMIIDIVSNEPYNWYIIDYEKIQLFAMITRLKEEIYNG